MFFWREFVDCQRVDYCGMCNVMRRAVSCGLFADCAWLSSPESIVADLGEIQSKWKLLGERELLEKRLERVRIAVRSAADAECSHDDRNIVDEWQPGFVECSLRDAQGRTWKSIEKVPVVTTEALWSDSEYPRPGVFA